MKEHIYIEDELIITKIIECVSNVYSLDVVLIKTPAKTKKIVLARQTVILLIRKKLKQISRNYLNNIFQYNNINNISKLYANSLISMQYDKYFKSQLLKCESLLMKM